MNPLRVAGGDRKDFRVGPDNKSLKTIGQAFRYATDGGLADVILTDGRNVYGEFEVYMKGGKIVAFDTFSGETHRIADSLRLAELIGKTFRENR